MYFLAFIFLYLQWIVFSGKFDAFHLLMGMVASFVTAYFTFGLIFQNKERTLKERFLEILFVPVYFFWLLYKIFQANFYILYLVFHPRILEKIDPQVVTIENNILKCDFSKFIFAHSVTLTPGTITVEVTDDKFHIYAINKYVAKDLGDMMKFVSKIFYN